MAKLSLKKVDSDAVELFPGHEAPPELDPTFLDVLNSVQRDAVISTDGPMLIVAGAGSGKTRVLTYRIAWLLAEGVQPWRILALTFTNKAAAEMKERIGALVGEDRAAPLWMGTFHSVFSRILRREAEKIGYTSSFTIYDTADSLGVIRQSMKKHGINAQEMSPKMVRNRISGAKNQLHNPALFRRDAVGPVDRRIADIYDDYESQLRANNAMDFDDLLVRTIELFRRHEEVLQKYQEQFRYVLIDEYQDTNRAQYMIVQMLAARHRNLTVVGDDAQSIYRFRGADIRNILDFERDYDDFRMFRLEQNYRSTKVILAAADSVIRNNRGQIKKELWTENVQGDPIRVETLRDERDEGRHVVELIRTEIARGTDLSEIAVLYRVNSQSLSIEDALRRDSIPYALVGGVAFYQRKEVKDALAYLRLLVNERDDESFLRAVNTPSRGIGEVTIRRLRTAAEASGESLLAKARSSESVPDLSARAINGLKRFAQLIDNAVIAAENLELPEMVRDLLNESGLLDSFKEEGTPEAMARFDNVQRLLSHIAEYVEESPDASLAEYLQEISLISEVDNYSAEASRVTLMTIHSAKGLEFDTVIIPGMEEQLFPVGASAEDQEELEEERRLFYVAVTRARTRLYLSNCERRYRFGELAYPTPSRFLSEIDDELVEFNSTAPRFSSGPSFSSGLGQTSRRRDNSSRKRAARSQQSRGPESSPEWTPDPEPAEDYSQVPQTLQAGATVRHEQFGIGKVTAITGNGDKTRVTVVFQKVGRKQLMLKFARLQIV